MMKPAQRSFFATGCAIVCIVTVAMAGVSATQNTAAPPRRIEQGFGKGAYPAGSLIPSLVETVEPTYTLEALQAGIEGDVDLEAVVGSDGRVIDVRVVKSLDKGLDERAMEAARKWRWRPATLIATPVSAVVTLTTSFHLHAAGRTDGPPFVESGQTEKPSGPEREPRDPTRIDPRVTKKVEPNYTSEAMRHKIEGVVRLEVVVGVDGRVSSARVVKSLDDKYGLDDEAVKAARKWTFTPGRLNGVAVPTVISLDLTFRLH